MQDLNTTNKSQSFVHSYDNGDLGLNDSIVVGQKTELKWNTVRSAAVPQSERAVSKEQVMSG
jgi:hypothetical protein